MSLCSNYNLVLKRNIELLEKIKKDGYNYDNIQRHLPTLKKENIPQIFDTDAAELMIRHMKIRRAGPRKMSKLIYWSSFKVWLLNQLERELFVPMSQEFKMELLYFGDTSGIDSDDNLLKILSCALKHYFTINSAVFDDKDVLSIYQNMNKTWSILRPEDALETYKSFVYQSFGNSDFEIIENVEMIDLIHPNKNAFDILLMKEITNLKDFFKHINYDYSILDMNRRHSLQTVRKYQDYVNNRRNKEFFGVCEYSDTVSSNQPSRNKKGKKVNKKQHKNEDEEAETNPKASSLEDYMRHYQIEEYDTHNDPKRLSYQVM